LSVLFVPIIILFVPFPNFPLVAFTVPVIVALVAVKAPP
jgi:hypothetical protein